MKEARVKQRNFKTEELSLIQDRPEEHVERRQRKDGMQARFASWTSEQVLY